MVRSLGMAPARLKSNALALRPGPRDSRLRTQEHEGEADKKYDRIKTSLAELKKVYKVWRDLKGQCSTATAPYHSRLESAEGCPDLWLTHISFSGKATVRTLHIPAEVSRTAG